MPGYKSHLAGGIVTFILVACIVGSSALSITTALEWFAFCLFGSLFPDVDTKSKGQKMFYRIMVVMVLVLAWQRRFMCIAALALVSFVPLLSRHRCIFHELWFLGLLAGSAVLCTRLFCPAFTTMVAWDALFFLAGAASHLFLDRGWRGLVRLP